MMRAHELVEHSHICVVYGHQLRFVVPPVRSGDRFLAACECCIHEEMLMVKHELADELEGKLKAEKSLAKLTDAG